MKNVLKRSISVVLALTLIFSSAYVGLNELDFGSLFAVKSEAASTSDLTFALSEYYDHEIYDYRECLAVVDCKTSATGSIEIPSEYYYDYSYLPVRKIESEAFYGCSEITSITIPDSIKYIGYDAFGGCSRLNSVYITDLKAWCYIYFERGADSLSCYSNPLCYASKFYVNGELATDIIVPEGVESISEEFWGYRGLTSITLPDSVTYIGNYAFDECPNLKSITFGSGIESIGDSLLGGYSLENVYITDLAAWCSVNFSYSGNPLKNASNLYINGQLATDIVIPNGVTSICDYAFEGYKKLKSVVIPDSVKSIGSYAFEYCSNLETVTIGSGVTSIGTNAFNGCSSLISVTIGSGVTSIGTGAFNGCTSFTEINVDENNAVYSSADGVLFNKNKTKLIQYPVKKNDTEYAIPDGVTNIERYAFSGCENLVSVNIPDSVKSIGSNAFKGCSNIVSIEIPNGVTSIGQGTFEDCSSLESVALSNSVTNIDGYAFESCSSLTSITIPDNVKNIGYSAFRYCENLASIILPDTVEFIEGYAFNDTAYYKNENNWENDVLYIGKHLVAAKSSLTGDVVVKAGTRTIAEYAFSNELISVTIPDSVTSISSYAFDGVENVYITNLEAWCAINFLYGSNPLGDAGNLYINGQLATDIVIPNGVTSIGAYAFAGCGNLKSVVISDSVKSIGDSAFGYCSNLETVTIGSGVTNIGFGVFECCDNLENVYITDLAAWCSVKFDVYSSNPLEYTSNLYIDGQLVTDVVIPNGVTSIGDYAFKSCDCITSVTIPDSVKSVGYSAFEDCSNLTSVTIGNGVTCIDSWAFDCCYGLENVYYRGLLSDWSKITINVGNDYLTNANISHICTLGDWIVDFEPDCVNPGSKYRQCLVCGKKSDVTAIPADGNHTFATEWTIDTEPTCDKAGSKSRHCLKCDEKTDIISIQATGHSYGDWITIVDPTCTEMGSKHKICSVCGDVVTEGVSAFGHLNTIWITEKEPTCTVDGYKDEYCLDCTELISTETILATGHSYGDWIVDSAPTCTEQGSRHKICSACGGTVNETTDVIDHSYSTEWTIDVAPTCTEDGSKSHHCTVCGEKTNITVIDATGHSYGNWVIDSAPTCTERGSRHKICSACGDTVNETTDVIDHSYSTEWIIDVAPTCTEDGSKSHHCTVCGDKADITVIASLGHDFEVVSTEEEHPHTISYKCSRCTEKEEGTSILADCAICNFSYTNIDDSTCRITAYIGGASSFVIPSTIDGRTVSTTTTGAFKNNTTLTSVRIENGVQGLGSLAFLGCKALSKIIIPETVTSIGANAFYNCASDFTIYCYRDSYAMQYAIDNSLNYIVMDIGETENTKIDYVNKIIFTTEKFRNSIDDIIYTPATSMAFAEASVINGNNEFLGTGSIVTVFDDDNLSEYTLIVEGDLNGDATCDVLDAAAAHLYSVGLDEPSENEILATNGCVSDELDANSYQNVVNMCLAS